MRSLIAVAGALAVILYGSVAYAQDTEVQKLKKEVEKLRTELDALKAKGDQEGIEDLEKELKKVKAAAQGARPGTTNFLLTGYGFAGFTDEKGGDSTFRAGLNPIFLWRLSDKLMFEGELELELESEDGKGEAHVELEYAHLTYILHDYVTIGAGLFLTPLGTFAERFHPDWINKLPDNPLAFGHGGLAPTSSLGVQLRGAIPVGPVKVAYALWFSNGPRVNDGDEELEEAGMLHFDNFEDINNSKAVGARLEIIPIPQLSISGSVLWARVNPDTIEDVDALLFSLDLSYVRDVDFLMGTFDLRAQWVWSDVDDATYGFGNPGGPVTITDNRRNGGYVQLAYRPSKVENDIVKNLELIVRYDSLRGPGDMTDEDRWTVGLDYWINPSTVVKVAYRFDDKKDPMAADADAFFLEFAMGF